MEFRILGPVEVIDTDGRSLALGPPRQQALLLLLLLHPGRRLSIERLIDLLWPKGPPRSAATIVHGSIAGLRRTLERPNHTEKERFIVTGPGGYSLNVQDDHIDAFRFEKLLAEGRRHLRTNHEKASAILSDALSLWRGPVAASAAGAGDFVQDAARRLDELRLDALEARVEADLALGRHGDLVGELENLVSEHPLRERLWAHLITALYRAGRQADALATYQALRKLLDEELGISPGPELRELEHAVLEHHPSLDAPGVVRGRPRLPSPLDAFVGRERERQEIAALLTDHRLVTIVGAAGIGKTRLAVEVGRPLARAFPAGTWFVDFGPLSTPELVAQRVADSLGVRAEAGVPLTDTVAAALGGRRALLVLDNCEHVLSACTPLVHAVVTGGPDVRVLATSREPLGLNGEAILALSPLRVAERDEPWERIAASEAVALFAARAAIARHGFRLTEADVGLVREICQRLDGLPLALELAAAHVGALSLRDIASRLDQRFRLLDARIGAIRQRHRGLTAAIDWSYDLLSEPERTLFQRLSLFAGGFTLQSAEAVVADGTLPASDVAVLLSHLVSRSLVQPEQLSPDHARYRMLEPLRQYARGRLEERPDSASYAARHADYFTCLVGDIEPHLYRGGSGPWLERLRTEHENLRAALEWSFGPAGHAHDGARLAGMLSHLWDLSGARTEGLHWVEAALHATASGSQTDPRMPLLAAAALLRLGLGDLNGARQAAMDQLALARISGDQRWTGDALIRIGTVAWARGELHAAEQFYDEALRELSVTDDAWRTAIALTHMARIQRDRGRLAEAKHTVEQSLGIIRRLGEDTVFGFTLDVLASIIRELHQPEEASALIEEALSHYRAVRYREGEASALQLAGRLLLQRGERAAAGHTLQNALELCAQIGHRAGIAASLEGLGEVMAATGKDRLAARLFGAAASRRNALGLLAPSSEQPARDAAWKRLRTTLGPEQLEQAWQDGADTNLDDLRRLAAESTLGSTF